MTAGEKSTAAEAAKDENFDSVKAQVKPLE
jgi:hypothetical protein